MSVGLQRRFWGCMSMKHYRFVVDLVKATVNPGEISIHYINHRISIFINCVENSRTRLFFHRLILCKLNPHNRKKHKKTIIILEPGDFK